MAESTRRNLLKQVAALGLGTVASGKPSIVAEQIPDQVERGHADFFPGFRQFKTKTSGAVINAVMGGKGRPLLLLHGYPQTHIIWRGNARFFALDTCSRQPNLNPNVNLNLCLLPVSGARPLSDGVRRELISAAETPRESFLDRRVRSVRLVLGFPTSGAFWPHNLRRFPPGSRRIRPEIAWVFRPRDLRQPVATSKMPRRPQVQILHGEISGAPHRRRAGRR